MSWFTVASSYVAQFCLSESGTCWLSLIWADYSNATDAIKIERKAEIEPKQFGINSYCSAANQLEASIYGSSIITVKADCVFLAATSITWTEPPPAWNQTDPLFTRTVDILVFNRSTQVHLKWNYILSAGSQLLSTTFSIIAEGSSNDIAVTYHGSGTTTIFESYRARFNINTSEVATLIINRATEREETTFECKLTTLLNPWKYRVRLKLTGKN